MAASAPPVAPPSPARSRTAPSRPSETRTRGVWRAVRPVLFWTHLAVGVVTGVVVLIMSLTGVLLTYQRQLTEWSAGANAIVAPAGATRLPLDSLLARAAAAAPAGSTPSALTVRADPSAAVVVSVGRRQNVYVDPYTGAVRQASPALMAFFHESERWHRSLATGESLRDAVGVTLTGACNLAFLFLIVSGMFLWWPRQWTWRAFRAVLLFQRRSTGRQRDWNWHHVLGIWSAPALAAVVFSAVFISYQWPQKLVQQITGSPAPAEAGRGGPAGAGAGAGQRGGEGARGEGRGGRGEGRAMDEAPAVAGASLETLLGQAAREVPGWYSVQLRLPEPGGRRVSATVSETGAMRPDMRTTLTLDARSAEVRERQVYTDQDTARRFRSWMRGLHTGEVAGVFGQTIAGLVSAAGVVLVYTGIALTWRRLLGSLARRRRDPGAAAAV